MDKLRDIIRKLSHISQHDLHIFGDAAVGKTHIASHICYERLEAELPALLVSGIKFTGDQPVEKQLLYILDIPPSYSWSDFLQALEAAAEAYHTRIPLVIDGLNEATQNGVFSEVWRLGLPSQPAAPHIKEPFGKVAIRRTWSMHAVSMLMM
jgi:hypothetical protein